MKQVVSNYSYSPATNVLTLSGVNIDQDQLLLVVAPGVGRTMYNFASGVTGVVSAGINTRVTLNASTASLTTTSPLVIYYDDQAISGTVTANGSRTFVDANAVTVSGFMSVGGWDSANYQHAPLPLTDSATGLYVAYDSSAGPFAIYGTVTVGNSITIGSCVTHGVNVANSVTISSLPAISGTVTIGAGTAQIGTVTASLSNAVSPSFPTNYVGDPYPVGSKIIPVGGWTQEVDGAHWQGLSISDQGSVLAQLSTGNSRIGVVTVGNSVTISALPVSLSTTTIGGTARLNVTLSSATTIGATAPSYGNLYGGSDGTNLRAISVDTSGRTVVTGSVSVANTVPVSGTVTANISGTVPVSISSVTIGNTVTVAGTVTANVASTTVTISAQPSGALTTRFGSVVTANTAGITTAVTNTSRKYLLAQNISTGTVTIGIGFSPTTTQGIQLTAGAGLTFDSFVPTGAVYWLGATTGAAYTILEG
jgi:hypothetical protein